MTDEPCCATCLNWLPDVTQKGLQRGELASWGWCEACIPGKWCASKHYKDADSLNRPMTHAAGFCADYEPQKPWQPPSPPSQSSD